MPSISRVLSCGSINSVSVVQQQLHKKLSFSSFQSTFLLRSKSSSSTAAMAIDDNNQLNSNTQVENNVCEINAGQRQKLMKTSSCSVISNNFNNFIFFNNFPSAPFSNLLNNNCNIIARNMATKCGKKGDYNVKIENINPNFIKMEYAVRGPLVIRAGEIEKELQAGEKKPFDQVIRANIGDAHAMGQKPITFLRQVLSLTVYPQLLESCEFPEDAKERARAILKAASGNSFGAYTESYGIELIRRQVADYIKRRDNIDADWTNVILTAGATAGIKGLLALLNCDVNGKKPGVMIPIPQYPLYSATLAEYGMPQVNYFLNESTNWGLDICELERAYEEGQKKYNVRALCIINPGNPTGQVLTRENIEGIIKFAHQKKLMLFADEVYQDNVYDPNSKFFSFKKVMTEMGDPYSKMELASFMSTSKGYLGECGIRGGYMEVLNIDPEVKAILLKCISASLCPTTAGQVACSVLVNPPTDCEPSYEQYMKEKTHVLDSLKERAELIYKTFNSFEGFSCNVVQGAMYAFPQIKIPPKAIEEAKKQGKPADTFYAFELLETSGICIVPGSGFGQEPGTYHFRTTILPQTDKLKIMLEKFKEFHAAFMQKYK